MAPAADLAAIRIHPRLNAAVHRVQEVLAVVMDVKAQQVVPQQTMQQLLAPRKGAEDLPVGPRNVPELPAHHPSVTALPEHARQQTEVIVLNEDQRPPIADLLHHSVGKDAVRRLISRPVLRTEFRPREGDVAERPEALIGQPVVKAALQLRVDPDATELVAWVLRRDHHTAVLIHRLPISVPCPMRHPGAA